MPIGSAAPLPVQRVVYKAIHRPLTIAGVERRLFFLALVMGGVTFNVFYSLLSGVLVAGGLYTFGLWVTRSDPQMLRIVIASARYRTYYDAAKHAPFNVEVDRC